MPMRLRSGRRVSGVVPEVGGTTRGKRTTVSRAHTTRNATPKRPVSKTAAAQRRSRSKPKKATPKKTTPARLSPAKKKASATPKRATIKRAPVRRRRATMGPVRRSTRIAKRKQKDLDKEETESLSESESSSEESSSSRPRRVYRKTPYKPRSPMRRVPSPKGKANEPKGAVAKDEDLGIANDFLRENISYLVLGLVFGIFHLYAFVVNRSFKGTLFHIPFVSDKLDFSSRCDAANIVLLSTLLWAWTTFFCAKGYRGGCDGHCHCALLCSKKAAATGSEEKKKSKTGDFDRANMCLTYLQAALSMALLAAVLFAPTVGDDATAAQMTAVAFEDFGWLSLGFYLSQLFVGTNVQREALNLVCLAAFYHYGCFLDACVLLPLVCCFVRSGAVRRYTAVGGKPWHWLQLAAIVVALNVAALLPLSQLVRSYRFGEPMPEMPRFQLDFDEFPADVRHVFDVVFAIFKPPTAMLPDASGSQKETEPRVAEST